MVAEDSVDPVATDSGVNGLQGETLLTSGVQDRCGAPRGASSMQSVVDDAGTLLPEGGQRGFPALVPLLPHGAELTVEGLQALLNLGGDGGQ